MKKLPVGIYTFSQLVMGNYLYVDKTPYILNIITSGKYNFLSRPRRFGKSLLVSTFKEIFSGNKDLFQGLFIYDKIDWDPSPVIHLDLSLIPRENAEVLKTGLLRFCRNMAGEHHLELSADHYSEAFAELIRKIAQSSQQNVVILIDEYDKPIVDLISDIPAAQKNRDVLKYFYEMIKASDQYLKFVFITGVSKFSKVSVFSGLNNLDDLTLDARYACVLGYTQQELETCFAKHIQHFCEEQQIERERLLAKIKQWYNGYSWNAKDSVYNPFSILNLFQKQVFRNYWFSSGTPSMLIHLIKQDKRDVTEFESQSVPELVFDSYDIGKLNLFALLFQTGYLTISAITQDEDLGLEYRLHYPNSEVQDAFLTYLLESFTTHDLDKIPIMANQLRRSLRQEDMEEFITLVRSMFAKIPYTLHIQEEAYYHSLFYMVLALMGVEIDLEVLTDKGRVDGVLPLEDKIYLIEFKYGKAGTKMETLTKNAIKQIREKKYAERFLEDPRKRILLGVGFVGKEIGYEIAGRRV